MSDEQETEAQRAEREARELAEQMAAEKRQHDTWRAMEKGRLAAFAAMAATLDKELGASVEPTIEAADWAMNSRARVLDALGVLMLPPGEPEPRPIDRFMDGLAAGIRSLAENPMVVQGFLDAMQRTGVKPPAGLDAPQGIDPTTPSQVDAINTFIRDCSDPSKVSDDTVLALADFLAKIAAQRKIGSFAEPSEP